MDLSADYEEREDFSYHDFGAPELQKRSATSRTDKILAQFMFWARGIVYSILYLVSRVISGHGVSILAYHSVDSNDSFYAVAPQEFHRQMEYVRRNYEVVSLDEIVDFVLGRASVPRRSVAITCDDGYYDSYSNVYPYLKKQDLPVTIFVATGRVGKKMTLGNQSLRMLGWDEILRMSLDNVTIGAHTVSHPNLQDMSPEEAKNEIVSSKRRMEEKIGKDVNYFAYPMGRYNERIVHLVRDLGFKAAFGGEGLVRQGDDPYVLHRVSVDASVTLGVFKARLTIATEWYKRLEQIGKRVIHRVRFLSWIGRLYSDQDLIKALRRTR